MDMEEFPERFDPVEVGASLREARIALRRDPMDVARDLRIRQVYIEAIEEGRFEDLPGLTYQTGFLRAYGNYLGLDGAEIADRLKTARDTTASQAELQVFSRVDEGHLPTRSVLMLAALLAIAVYGVWYFLANTEGDPVERVAALPDRLASLLEREPDPGTGDAAPGPTADTAPPAPAKDAPPPPTPQRSARAGDNVAGGSGETTLAAVTEPSAPVPEPRAETPAPPTATATPGSEPATPRAEPEPAAQPPVPSDPPAANPATEVTTTPLPPPSPPTADEDSGAAQPPGTGPGNTDAVPRLLLRAVTDSWIEIRSGDAPPLYSGLLREGESYAVPERQGLKLVTGNAGGLEILVDGQVMPRLGPPGAVIRDIDLDRVRRQDSG